MWFHSFHFCRVILSTRLFFIAIRSYADTVNLTSDDIIALERNGDVLLNACKHIGLAVNTGKTNCMEVGSHRDMMTNEHTTVGGNSYEKKKPFKYLHCLLTDQNYVHEEIKCRLKKVIHVIT